MWPTSVLVAESSGQERVGLPFPRQDSEMPRLTEMVSSLRAAHLQAEMRLRGLIPSGIFSLWPPTVPEIPPLALFDCGGPLI